MKGKMGAHGRMIASLRETRVRAKKKFDTYDGHPVLEGEERRAQFIIAVTGVRFWRVYTREGEPSYYMALTRMGFNDFFKEVEGYAEEEVRDDSLRGW